MKIYCPFNEYGIFDCVYLMDDLSCEDIQACPGNSDSMCGNSVLHFINNNLPKKNQCRIKFCQECGKDIKHTTI